MEIVKKLVNIRTTLGYTTEEWAEKIGTSQSTISRLENEEDDNVKIGRIKSYCEIAGITILDFFSNEQIETKLRPEIKELVEIISTFTPSAVKDLSQFLTNFSGCCNNHE